LIGQIDLKLIICEHLRMMDWLMIHVMIIDMMSISSRQAGNVLFLGV
jgi:hypothetical protein